MKSLLVLDDLVENTKPVIDFSKELIIWANNASEQVKLIISAMQKVNN